MRSADGERGGAGKPPGSIDSCACYPPASADDFAASQDDAAGGAAPARFTAVAVRPDGLELALGATRATPAS